MKGALTLETDGEDTRSYGAAGKGSQHALINNRRRLSWPVGVCDEHEMSAIEKSEGESAVDHSSVRPREVVKGCTPS